MNASVQTVSMNEVTSEIQKVFAEITRYPLEILDIEADLETDLGIDSVKLGEVFSVLREKYNLPAQMDIPRENLKNIAGISAALEQYCSGATLRGNGTFNETPISPQKISSESFSKVVDFPKAEADPVNLEMVKSVIRNVFAEVTRYPLEILDIEADLETDLGIDSVKLGEVFSVLREKYNLPAQMDIPRENLKNIAGISHSLQEYLLRADVSAAPEAKQNVNTRPPKVSARDSHTPDSDAISHSFAGLDPQRKPFSGKVALVTGSGRGLGKDMAIYLAELGASVVVNSFHSRDAGETTVKEITAKGGNALHAWGSMANPDHISGLFEQIERHYGALDFYVANASNGMLGRLEDITPEHWEKAYRTNVVGLHQCALRAVKLMRQRGGGKIITLSSPASHGYVDYFGCMGAVKAAVESLTRSMAIEFSPDNIQVNCISPGPIYGDLLNKWPESERLIAQWEGNTAYDRLCESRDVSHFVAYLLSEPVKLFNGSVLVMDGGISISGF